LIHKNGGRIALSTKPLSVDKMKKLRTLQVLKRSLNNIEETNEEKNHQPKVF